MTNNYRRQDIIDWSDSIAQSFKNEKSGKYRDHFFPALIDAMELKIGVEIGVDKGGFTEHLLTRSNVNMVYGIDPWIDDFGSDCQPGYFDPNGENRQAEAASRLASFIPERCTLIKGFSQDVAQNFESNSVDFCYIDGDHSLEGIYTDIYTWTDKVRSGGILSGHDYKDGPKSGMSDYWGNQLDYKVKTVVDNFCQQYGFKLNVIGGRILSWWFVKNV